MKILTTVLVTAVALEHLFFLVLEMFLWTKPLGLRVFGQSLEKAQNSAVLAANQGLYNGFLAAGLVFGLLQASPDMGNQILAFFLTCVVIAGIYGSYSVSFRILWVQAMPAALALACLLSFS